MCRILAYLGEPIPVQHLLFDTDTFMIETDSYEAAGPVQHGNVQLHKQQGSL